MHSQIDKIVEGLVARRNIFAPGIARRHRLDQQRGRVRIELGPLSPAPAAMRGSSGRNVVSDQHA